MRRQQENQDKLNRPSKNLYPTNPNQNSANMIKQFIYKNALKCLPILLKY